MTTTEKKYNEFFIDDRQKIYEKLIKKYGKIHQLWKLYEELSELTTDLVKILNDDEKTDNYIIELVDVIITIEQYMTMFNIQKKTKLEKAENISEIITLIHDVQGSLLYFFGNKKRYLTLKDNIILLYSYIVSLYQSEYSDEYFHKKLTKLAAKIGLIYQNRNKIVLGGI
jgi:hypothetical protein